MRTRRVNYLLLLTGCICLATSGLAVSAAAGAGERIEQPFQFRPFALEWENSGNSKLNLSSFLEKPAGKDGFITIKDGHFVKPSGERFKIWGVNLAFGACFPDKTDAPKVAAYLARFGINAVRLHFLDSCWGRERSLLSNQDNYTRNLNPKQFDNLDYFVAELKKAGIYSDINLNVGRMYKEGDGVPEFKELGLGKGATQFNERLIELQKEYARQLLTHRNPYTGNTYANEPAVVLVEILNENSLVEAWFSGRLAGSKRKTGVWADLSPYYRQELTDKYNQWLKSHASQADMVAIAKESGVAPGEAIPRLAPAEFKKASELRFHTEAKFIIETERKFFLGMYIYLKNELGVKASIVATSDADHSASGYAMLSSASKMDVVDGHVYWHYYWGKSIDKKTGKARLNPKDNTPMVSVTGYSTVVQLSRSAVEGKPYTVSEINNGSYNQYYCEGAPIAGAYAALQDWDGLFFFALAHVEPNAWNDFKPGGLDCVVDPIRMANLLAAGLMYQRGDLKASEACVYRGYTEKEVIEGIRMPANHFPFFTPGLSPLTPLIQKTRIRSFDTKIADFPEVKDASVIQSDTGEIAWHDEATQFVEIASPRSEALIGFMGGAASKLKHLRVAVKNEFAAITLTSLDGKPLASAEKILLVTTARAGLSGMQWNEEQGRLTGQGKRPITIEVLTGEIELKNLTGAKGVIVEPLDGTGNPMRRIALPVEHGSARLTLGRDVTVWCTITVQR